MLEPPPHLGWLYLDLNSYFASVEQQVQPHLRGKPVAVVPAMTDATCAIAASYEAKAFGVKTGTMIYEARKLCPGLQIVPARHNVYVDYHHRILAEIDRHLPITKVCSIDEVACRLMKNERAPDIAAAIGQKIKDGIRENVGIALRSSVGIAPNQFLSKVASNLQKPDGLTILQGHDLPERLFAFSLRDLPGIGANIARRLQAAGVNDVETFWHLPPKQVRQIWGSVQGERFWYALHGIEVTTEETQRRTIGHSHVLEPQMRPLNEARLVARRLTIKAASRLRREGYFATHFALGLRFDKSPARYAQHIAIPAAQDNFTFLAALDELWQQMIRQSPPPRIKKVAVTLYGLIHQEQRAPDLFADQDNAEHNRAQMARLSFAMDQINSRFGLDAVVLGSLPRPLAKFTGTKIAFTRIPDKAEFNE